MVMISCVRAHPNPHSFSHAVADTVISALKQEGHEIRFHDLCREKFDCEEHIRATRRVCRCRAK